MSDRRSADPPDVAAVTSMVKDLRTALRDVDRGQGEARRHGSGLAW